jgi:hypothetical protein
MIMVVSECTVYVEGILNQARRIGLELPLLLENLCPFSLLSLVCLTCSEVIQLKACLYSLETHISGISCKADAYRRKICAGWYRISISCLVAPLSCLSARLKIMMSINAPTRVLAIT